ncbi:uncharacterized protein F5Z01DRAFT_221569 [Emericellopsis atlantica]|uniref:Uncharacterized protein n=1 Tax=Emericellopsis atlantica TaxID=2614577 RepID=A0A9P8CPD0_9HYPO|nr:uncharacterized protein F5Z01DRAFT_221569 [Emericellopsis atlantica]KAG9252646.1 hypothetical protein F5Z01DRAFT_221569 [Emericellopsis atlantica]
MDNPLDPMTMDAELRHFDDLLRETDGLEELPGPDPNESDRDSVTPPIRPPSPYSDPNMIFFQDTYRPTTNWEVFNAGRVDPDLDTKPWPDPDPNPEPEPDPYQYVDMKMREFQLAVGSGRKPKDEPEPRLGVSGFTRSRRESLGPKGCLKAPDQRLQNASSSAASDDETDEEDAKQHHTQKRAALLAFKLHQRNPETLLGMRNKRILLPSGPRRAVRPITGAESKFFEGCWEEVENERTVEARTNWACTHKTHQRSEDEENERMIQSMATAHQSDLVTKATSRSQKSKEEHAKWAKAYKDAKDAEKRQNWEQRQAETGDEHVQSEFVDLSVQPNEQ